MLSSLSIALQGLGLRLTPIAVAVQGLLALLRVEEPSALIYFGAGGKPGRRTLPVTMPRRSEPSYEEVAAQWDLLEARLRPAPASAVQSKPVAPVAPVTAQAERALSPHVAAPWPRPASAVSTEAPQIDSDIARREALADDEALILLLLEAS